jgi:hydroxyethylthiazole kinase
MVRTGREARRRGIPVVLDPVGSGATRYRTETAQRLLDDVGPTIVRGNASEIASLVLAGATTKGVESTRVSDETVEAALAVSARWECVVSVSGATDVIVGAGSVLRVRNGHPMMTRVTGMGCTATAVTGAFASVNPQPLEAAAHAMALMGIAGEMAVARADGPGSLQMHFLDVLSTIGEPDATSRLKLDRE